MARKPDILCAGTCGRLIWRGKGVLPEGRSMCRPCRAASRSLQDVPGPRQCCGCSAVFEAALLPSGRPRRTCSEACRFAAARRARGKDRVAVRPCPTCGAPVLGKRPTRTCDRCREVKRFQHNLAKAQLRFAASAAVTTRMTMTELGNRDGWRCHLCDLFVDRGVRNPHAEAPTIDHLLPVSAGGTDAPENLRLAHRECNTRRGARGVVQLLLFG